MEWTWAGREESERGSVVLGSEPGASILECRSVIIPWHITVRSGLGT